jgi:UDP-N-acetylglucosamine 2-epimerase
MNYPAAELRSIKMNFYLINPDAEHRGILLIKMGTNILAGTKKEAILGAFEEAVARHKDQFKVPPKWDGKAAERIWKILLKKTF